MPLQRDEQEYEARRQQIIDGALEVFANKGFEEATNRDIARAARIGSPGLIYHYFKDKADLFKQVLEERAPVLQILNHPDAIMDLPPREALTKFGMLFLKTVENRAAMGMVKMMVGEAFRRPAVAEVFSRIGPGRGLTILARYISLQIEKGTMKPMDPRAAARCFVGPLLAYVLTREVFVQPDAKTLKAETMLETTISIFLQGMEVGPSSSE